jgi:hypothetical protein
MPGILEADAKQNANQNDGIGLPPTQGRLIKWSDLAAGFGLRRDFAG